MFPLPISVSISSVGFKRRIFDVARLRSGCRLEKGNAAAAGTCRPSALQSAHELKLLERLTRVGIVSGTAPFDEPGLCDGIDSTSLRFIQLARTKPWLCRLTPRLMGLMARFAPRQIVKGVIAALHCPRIYSAECRITLYLREGLSPR